MPGHPVESQQQFLLQHPVTPVLSTEATDHRGNRLAPHRLADQRIGGVVAAHHHLLPAHQQVDQGILQLGVHQSQGSGDATHHAPVALAERPAVDLLQQVGEFQRLAALGAHQQRIDPQAALQLLQHFALLAQRGAAPEALGQLGHG
jgi:hypothetical protein